MPLKLGKGMLFQNDNTLQGESGHLAEVDEDGNLNTDTLADSWIENTATARNSIAITHADTYDIHFKPDGSKFYLANDNTDVVEEWTMSANWNVSTATLTHSLDISVQTGTPRGLSLSTIGTKMYLNSAGSTYEYDLSTPWDVSTATVNQSLVTANMLGTFFKQDGKKMYGITAGDDVEEWHLSTAWDISTATSYQVYDVSGVDAAPRAIFFNKKGTVMVIAGDTATDYFRYYLSTPWDVNTAVYDVTIASAGETGGIFFNPEGTKIYTVNQTGTTVTEKDMTLV